MRSPRTPSGQFRISSPMGSLVTPSFAPIWMTEMGRVAANSATSPQKLRKRLADWHRNMLGFRASALTEKRMPMARFNLRIMQPSEVRDFVPEQGDGRTCVETLRPSGEIGHYVHHGRWSAANSRPDSSPAARARMLCIHLSFRSSRHHPNSPQSRAMAASGDEAFRADNLRWPGRDRDDRERPVSGYLRVVWGS